MIADVRPVLALLGAAALAAAGGALLGMPALVVAGGLVLAAGGGWLVVRDPLIVLIASIAARPVVDLFLTYEVGPGLTGPASAGIAGLLVLVAWRHREGLLVPGWGAWGSVALVTAAVLSTMGSGDLARSAGQVFRLGLVAAAFIVALVAARDRRWLPGLCVALVFGGVFAATVALLQYTEIIPMPGDVGSLDAGDRPPGPFPVPTVLPSYFLSAGGAIVVLATLAWRHVPAQRAAVGVAGAAAMVWFAAAGAVNASRGPLLGVVVAVLVGLVVARRFWPILGVLMLALAGVALIPSEAVRLDEVGLEAPEGLQADSIEWRLQHWEDNLPRFEANPLTGIGLGEVERIHMSQLAPHSIVVQTLVEMGLVGMVGLVWLGVGLLHDVWPAARRGEALAGVAVGLMVGYFVIGLSENLLSQAVTSLPVAALTGACIGTLRLPDRVGGDAVTPGRSAPVPAA